MGALTYFHWLRMPTDDAAEWQGSQSSKLLADWCALETAVDCEQRPRAASNGGEQRRKKYKNNRKEEQQQQQRENVAKGEIEMHFCV